jgi:hypothetical protein
MVHIKATGSKMNKNEISEEEVKATVMPGEGKQRSIKKG